VYYLVGPDAMYLFMRFENNVVYVPSHLYDMAKCGIKVMKSKQFSKVQCFPHEEFILVVQLNRFNPSLTDLFVYLLKMEIT